MKIIWAIWISKWPVPRAGITALQMDIKIQGITKEILHAALIQAKEGRLHILGIMKQALPTTREDISEHAPRIIKIKINPEKIRDVIGKGGAVIRALTEETGTTIDIADDGTVMIACISAEGGELARKRIEDITAEVEVGRIYDGTVLKLLDFGAIVSVLPGKDGLLHISQIANERVNNVTDHLKEGQVVRVKVLEADDKGRLRLSMKAVSAEVTDNTAIVGIAGQSLARIVALQKGVPITALPSLKDRSNLFPRK